MFSAKSYDLNAELEKTRIAAAAGKKIILFIGRGSKQGVLDSDKDTHYCFLSPIKDNFSFIDDKSSSDFVTTLIQLSKENCKNLFDEVIIDGGTMDHLINDFDNNLDSDSKAQASLIAGEISDGQLFDEKKIAAFISPIIYQFDAHSLIYYEYLLRMLAEMSRRDLQFIMSFGNDAPWTAEKIRMTATSLKLDPTVQINDAAIMAWYLIARKECYTTTKEGGKENKWLPKNSNVVDQHVKTNTGSQMFSGQISYHIISGLKPELKKTASSQSSPSP
jgi:hypothetical protein